MFVGDVKWQLFHQAEAFANRLHQQPIKRMNAQPVSNHNMGRTYLPIFQLIRLLVLCHLINIQEPEFVRLIRLSDHSYPHVKLQFKEIVGN